MCCSVALVMSDCLQPHGPSPEACSNSCPLSWWGHPTISSCIVPFSSCLQSFPPSGSFLMSQLFTAGSQSTRASASASVLPVNIQDLFPLGLTGLISLKSKGLSRVFCSIPWNHRSFYVHFWSLSTRTQALFARPWKNIWIFPPRFPTLHQFLMVHRNDKSRIAKVFFF